MRMFDVPVAPGVLGLILGPLAEQQFRRALAISQGDPSVFFTHPISLRMLVIALLLVFVPLFSGGASATPICRPARQLAIKPDGNRRCFQSASRVSLLTLTALEVVLSIDNLVVIAVLVGKLPPERQAQARYIGMTLALIPRLILLFFISWMIGLTEPLFELFGHGFSGKDLILAAGGCF